MRNKEIIKEPELIRKVQSGDSAAFADLIHPHRQNLITYLKRLAGNNSTIAEDIFQETLVKVWKGIKKYKEQKKFSSWLFSIAHNVALDEYRKSKDKKDAINIDDVHEKLGDNNNPHTIFEFNEFQQLLLDALEKLPNKQKQVFLLRQHSNMTFKEIAATTAEPLNTVLGHMHYAVKKIKLTLRSRDG